MISPSKDIHEDANKRSDKLEVIEVDRLIQEDQAQLVNTKRDIWTGQGSDSKKERGSDSKEEIQGRIWAGRMRETQEAEK